MVFLTGSLDFSVVLNNITFSPTDHVVSTVTHRKYDVINHENNFVDCSSANLFTCKKCGLQYVGQAVQQVRKRMNKHMADITKRFG